MSSLPVVPECTPTRRNGERGATAVEYSILASLIAAVIAATVALLGTTVLGLFQSLVFP
jgi:Flp pilus assembly pilin Flp